GEFRLPFGTQRRIVEDDLDDLGTMVRGLADRSPDDALHLARDDFRLRGIAADCDGDAGAFAIEPEVLRGREADHRLRHGGDDLADAIGVLLEAVAEAEIGEVDEGESAGALKAGGNRVPLFARQARTGRV